MSKHVHIRITLLCLLLTILAVSVRAQFVFQSPVNGSKYNKTKTAILLRAESAVDQSSLENRNWIHVEGSKSGLHSYTAKVAGDGRTIIVKPDRSFSYDETVSVIVGDKLLRTNGQKIEGRSFSFETEKEPSSSDLLHREEAKKIYDEDIMPGPVEPTKYNIDSLPTYQITVNDHPARGSIFWNNQNDLAEQIYTNCYNVIMSNTGKITYAQDMGTNGHDFKINYNGYLTYHDYFQTQWIEVDSNFYRIDSFQCSNGYESETDGHDFIIYPDGHYFLFAYDSQTMDMTQYGGQPNATVIGFVIQEFDKDKNLLFQWRSWDHLNITDCSDNLSLTTLTVDYVHGNAVEQDNDGNLLYSSRSMTEIVKLNLETGDIMWRMGGENNQFTFLNDPQVPHLDFQHDVRRLPNGHLTFFNNGNFLPTQQSSAKEFVVDEVNKTAKLVWSYTHPKINGTLPVFGSASGSVQRLSNGNTLIGWGTVIQTPTFPNATEVDSLGNIVWEMVFDTIGIKSYRFHKYEWLPCARPTGFTMVSIVKPGKVKVSWGAATGAKSYALQYRKTSVTQWTQIVVTKPTYTFNDLESNTTYKWRLKSSCGPGNASEFSDEKVFTTGPQKEFNFNNSDVTISLYPNPAEDLLHIHLPNDLKTTAMISVFNNCGSLISSVSIDEGVQDYEMNIEQLTAGIYTVKVQTENSNTFKQFVKE